jgi:ABC-2 type transport system permease protein
MRSKTSFFNRTVFLKNFTRFWPIWALYLVVWILLMPVAL